MNTETPIRLIRKPQVLDRVQWSDTTLWRRVRDGGFPKPIRISPGAVAWRSDEVDAWIEARTQARG